MIYHIFKHWDALEYKKEKNLEEVIQSHHASVSHLQYGDNNKLLSAMLVDEKVVIGVIGCYWFLTYVS